MIVLGLDTTGSECSVSLVDEAAVRGHVSRNIGRGHAEVLAGMVEEVFESANLKSSDVDRLAVCTGPGSFTGLRVALSFAKGFALPRALPVVGIDALEVTAKGLDPESARRIAVSQDVRRGEFFYALYNCGTAEFSPEAMLKEDMERQALAHQANRLHDVKVDTRILAWMAMEKDPQDYPAEPLYSRGPDAKLPGGITLPESSPKSKS